MLTEWSSNWQKQWLLTSAFVAFLAAFGLLHTVPAQAAAPDWMRAAASLPLPSYPEDTAAVILLDDQVTTVKDNGEIDTLYRRVYKILNIEGREFGTVRVYFDSDTRLAYLKGWSLTGDGKEYEVKEKDAVETSPFGGVLFQDTRLKELFIPASEPGNLVGYEYQQRRRPRILQDSWDFQNTIPVRQAHFSLGLPTGWEFKPHWLHYATAEPRLAGSSLWAWELENIPAIEHEDSMPAWLAVAGRLGVSFYPPKPKNQLIAQNSWEELGRWYAQLTLDRRQTSPPIRQKALELTAKDINWLDKVRSLASFVQRDIRYVAIELGIGGFLPHAANDVFSNRYGDCKDKATLLSSMLQEIGVKSDYVLLRTSRGVIAPEFPSLFGFNHVILAIKIPPEFDSATLPAAIEDSQLGKFLLFDPTDSLTPIGFLPPEDQQNLGLLVHEQGGTLVNLPLVASAYNRLLRQASLTLSSTGALVGNVTELRTGAPATELKSQLLRAQGEDRIQILENFLASSFSGFVVQNATVEGLNSPDSTLIVRYRFSAEKYAQSVGNLLLVRPRVLGVKSQAALEGKPRKYPLEFPYSSLESDIYEITLPTGYAVDELPPALNLDGPVSSYHSQSEVKSNALLYKRTYTMKEVEIPSTQLEQLKKFFRQISIDERSLAVLKRNSP